MADEVGKTKSTEKGRGRPGPETALREIMVGLAQVHLAGVLTGAAFVKEWAEATTRYEEEVYRSLTALARSRKAYREVADEVTREYERYLRQMASLPRTYGLRFYSEWQRIREETEGISGE